MSSWKPRIEAVSIFAQDFDEDDQEQQEDASDEDAQDENQEEQDFDPQVGELICIWIAAVYPLI